MQDSGGLTPLPAKAGTCVHCATEHGKDDPHNFQSIFWGIRFKMRWGRDPTHADCVAHLSPRIQTAYREVLLLRYDIEWTEPKGEPVSEPYEVSKGMRCPS